MPHQQTSGSVQLRDDEGRITPSFVLRIADALISEDAQLLKSLVVDVHETDIADLLEALPATERTHFVRLMGDEFDFTALTEVDDVVRLQIIEELTPEAVAEGVRELDSDDAVYILEDLGEAEQEKILGQMSALERISLERSLDYPEDSAGRLMKTDLIAVGTSWTVGQTIDFMRETADLPEEFHEIFVVDPTHKLVGTVALNRILRAQRPIMVSALMDEARHLVRVHEDQEEVAHMFERYNLISVAVVDESERLMGVITVDDVVDVVRQESTEVLSKLAGVGDEEVSDTVWDITRTRFLWLLVNLATAFLASSVLGLFKDQIQQMVALSILAPIVASQGGNAATQTMTVAVRALATRELGFFNIGRFVTREVLVALLNGLAFALLVGLAAGLWFQNVGLGLVIGGAMVANLLAGGLAGVLIPLAVDKFEGDPAVVSGVFVTTVTDCVGFFAFLGFASLYFGLI